MELKPENTRNPARKIIHVDMDAFYASVEQRDRPELKGKPVVVGGDPHGRGVVASASYEARKFGIRSAMSCAKALRLCPKAIFVYPDFERYKKASRQIQEIFHSVTHKVEPLSLDEAYLDVTENLLGEPLAKKIAMHIKNRIRGELGLTASAGAGPNKFVAKVASDLRKPDGLVVVAPPQVLEFVEKLPVERLWGVGPATAQRLHELGLWTAADIRKRKPEELTQALGKFGAFIYGLAFGEDDREVETDQEAKSCGSETTFDKDVTRTERLIETIEELSDEVSSYLRKMERPGRTITLKVRYQDFKTITRSRTLPKFTDDVREIAQTATDLLLGSTDAWRRPVRLVGVTVSGLLDPSEPMQLWLDLRYGSGRVL